MLSKLATLVLAVGVLAGCATAEPDTAGHGRRFQVVVIGDSFTSGSAECGVGPNGWPALVRKTLGEKNIDVDIRSAPEGGSGYAIRGHNGGVFGDIAERWMADKPQLIGGDGIHPTNEGHEYLAQKIAPLVANALTKGERRVTVGVVCHARVNPCCIQ
jgi:lysophospholipase L1-like esterase